MEDEIRMDESSQKKPLGIDFFSQWVCCSHGLTVRRFGQLVTSGQAGPRRQKAADWEDISLL